jgi:replication-associated recombination protein RarA
LARLIAQYAGATYKEFSATTASVSEVRDVIEAEKKKKTFFAGRYSTMLITTRFNVDLLTDDSHKKVQ